MTTVVVLFNLQEGVDPAEYEEWARTVDIPNVRRLSGCSGFEVLRTEGLMNGSPDAPFAYVELIHIRTWRTSEALSESPRRRRWLLSSEPTPRAPPLW